MKRQRTQQDLKDLLAEQLQFLESSANAFDNGFEGEAKRLAVSLRVLLHDTKNSHSLLGQLSRKSANFLDTAIPDTPWNVIPHGGPVFINGGTQPRFVAMLDRSMRQAQLSFDTWWNAPAFRDDKGEILTRKNLVLIAANQDGGAHVDSALDETYARLSKDNAFGWFVTSETGLEAMPGPEKAAIRQVAHEVLKTLLPNYKKEPVLEETGIVIGAASLVSVSASELTQTLYGRKVGRNEKCPCGSGKKYKKCHGAYIYDLECRV